MALVSGSSIAALSSSSLISNKLHVQSQSPTSFISTRNRVVVRASSNKTRDGGDGGISGVLDGTKKEITRDEVLKNQAENESEKRSVFGAVPSSGSFYPRPEVERRPETGDRSFPSLMAFDGAGPETINGRLAMVGLVWAFAVERMTGQTVAEQLYSPGSTGLFHFLAVAQLFAYASLVPMFKGESPDSRSIGPFRAMAERWNGRTAMLGFLALVVTEFFTKTPVFHMM
ncbi:early light-induced protein, chloroplastic-like [Selaginella moellendorffii]|uniref:early light-induced protein, chloroplastic-like n=1 Tax=Selaginella moellendorffii TaxID=88036 RepID=UPI000D1CFDBE|nr:early light-induced protein, chloroplastic-like [Selaginella moellendorffii]|eukprot:XP_024538579.1 early light-induced protein, chloroplastic-like [Selaginella moellendorffii]